MKPLFLFQREMTPLRKLLLMKAVAGGAPLTEYTATGNPATFETNVAKPLRSLVVPFSPVQDLHGYDSPWPAGGGKNLLKTDGLTAGAPSNTAYSNATARTFAVGTYISGLTVNNYYYARVTSVTVSANSVIFTTTAMAYGVSIPITGLTIGEDYTISATKTNGNVGLSFYKEDGTFISGGFSPSDNNYYTATVPSEAYYTLVVFNGQENDTESTFTDIQLEKSSSPTNYAPYSNICPITGWTGANVTRTGKNVLNLSEWETESNSGITIGTDNISIINKGYQENLNRYNVLNRSACVFSFHVKTVALADSRASFSVYVDGTTKLVGSDTTVTGNIALDSVGTEKDITLTVPSGTEYISFGGWAWSGKVQISTLQLELGSTASSYEPYHGSTYPITFPSSAGTVYGGSLTVNEDGSVTLVSQFEKRKMTAINWSYMSSSQRFESGYMTSEAADALLGEQTVYCSCYKAVPNELGTSYLNGEIGFNASNSSNPYLIVKDSRYTSTADFVASLTDDDEIIFKLRTAREYTLPSIEALESMLGVNNVWTDTNGVNTIKYMKKG